MVVKSSNANRRFGRSLAGVCGVFALIPLLTSGTPGYIALCLGLLVLAISQWSPEWLNPVRIGFNFVSAQLHKVMSPIFLGAIFFLVFVPGSFVVRDILRIDPLRIRRKRKVETYWIPHDAERGQSAGMKDQF